MKIINQGSNRSQAATYSVEAVRNYLAWADNKPGHIPILNGNRLHFSRSHFLESIIFTDEELFNFKMDFSNTGLFRSGPPAL